MEADTTITGGQFAWTAKYGQRTDAILTDDETLGFPNRAALLAMGGEGNKTLNGHTRVVDPKPRLYEPTSAGDSMSVLDPGPYGGLHDHYWWPVRLDRAIRAAHVRDFV